MASNDASVGGFLTDSVADVSSPNAINFAYSIDCINVLAPMVTILSYFYVLEQGVYERNQVKISSSANHVVVN
ncbi:hypothetical protein [Serratia fonticola]|uniref:hypothetical protein n=1 Tax=Serratia fonticola TaxID=47917 RepID=UPI003BB4BA58